MKLYLEFDESQGPTQCCRLEYAFRCFCAIYGHEPVPNVEARSADAWISYSSSAKAPAGRKALHLPKLYCARVAHMPAPCPQRALINGTSTVVIHGSAAGGADWLGEIFEWLSCADEYSIGERDAAGRVPLSRTLMRRYGLDVFVPYAAVAMHRLQNSLSRMVGPIGGPECPRRGIRQFVVNTHDIDFLPLTSRAALFRVAKNSLISLRARKLELARGQAAIALRMAFGGASTFLPLQTLANREVRRGVSATYFFLVRHGHRRDANYRINDAGVSAAMRYLESVGMEVGLHSSYTSLDQPNRVASEFNTLRSMGFRPRGGRQHWLRLSIDRLIDSVQRANALYDASLGWVDTPGFRAGACFAFPPYDFTKEKPAAFLELPLVIMDASLMTAGDLPHALQVARTLLDTSGRLGWGGFSVLWHPAAFGGAQLPAWLGDAFWSLMDSSLQASDAWVSAQGFVESVRDRYVAVGLLPRDFSYTQPNIEAKATG